MSTLIDYRRLLPPNSVGLCWASGPRDGSIDATMRTTTNRVRSSLSLLLRSLTNPAICGQHTEGDMNDDWV